MRLGLSIFNAISRQIEKICIQPDCGAFLPPDQAVDIVDVWLAAKIALLFEARLTMSLSKPSKGARLLERSRQTDGRASCGRSEEEVLIGAFSCAPTRLCSLHGFVCAEDVVIYSELHLQSP